jgi:hypothetical protein
MVRVGPEQEISIEWSAGAITALGAAVIEIF